ncbi:MAG TPA: RNA polymerase sigma-70 factor [Bacteroidetes bacterium]|nr:RNA polymerase sigma-70 factor [Bacteroidota bacterium]
MILTPELVLLFFAFAKQVKIDWSGISVAIRNGDHKAFQIFYGEYYDAVYRFLVSRGMTHDDAKDLIQKAFLLIWEKRETIDETKSLRAYLFQIAYTRMLNHINFNSKFSDESPEESDSQFQDPNLELDYSELVSHLKKIVSAMPEKRSLVFELCFMKQMTYKEVADVMGLSVKTIENHMAFAFKDVRQALTLVYGDNLLKSNDFSIKN